MMGVNGAGNVKPDLPTTPKVLLALISFFSLVLNLWGNRWGLPDFWHPDEQLQRSVRLVEDRTLNPHFFAYGGLHDYLKAVGAVMPVKAFAKLLDPVPTRGESQKEAWESRQIIRMGVLARSISAVASALLVAATACLATALFKDVAAGVIAGCFLAVSMFFVAIAHFSTVDATGNFLYWLSCLFALLYWRRGTKSSMIAAALVAGLAFGTKIDRVLVVIPVGIAYAFTGGVDNKKPGIAALLLVAGAGWVLTNPTAILSPFEFWDGFTRDLFFNVLRKDYWSSNPQLAIPRYFREALGMPLFLLVLLAGGYGVYRNARRHEWKGIAWLASAFLPAFWVLYTTKFLKSWYVVFFLPPLMSLTAYGCVELFRRLNRPYRMAAIAAVGVVWGVSLSYTFALVRQFTHDARYAAAAWIEANVPPGSGIALSGDLMDLSDRKYRVVHMKDLEYTPFLLADVKRLEDNGTYQAARAAILNLERLAGKHLGTLVRPNPYRAWFDQFRSAVEKEGYGQFPDRRNPDHEPEYLVAVGELNSREILQRPEYLEKYHLSVEYTTDSMFSFVNPAVRIFRRRVPGGDFRNSSRHRTRRTGLATVWA